MKKPCIPNPKSSSCTHLSSVEQLYYSRNPLSYYTHLRQYIIITFSNWVSWLTLHVQRCTFSRIRPPPQSCTPPATEWQVTLPPSHQKPPVSLCSSFMGILWAWMAHNWLLLCKHSTTVNCAKFHESLQSSWSLFEHRQRGMVPYSLWGEDFKSSHIPASKGMAATSSQLHLVTCSSTHIYVLVTVSQRRRKWTKERSLVK